jgi:hypothetical protein
LSSDVAAMIASTATMTLNSRKWNDGSVTGLLDFGQTIGSGGGKKTIIIYLSKFDRNL